MALLGFIVSPYCNSCAFGEYASQIGSRLAYGISEGLCGGYGYLEIANGRLYGVVTLPDGNELHDDWEGEICLCGCSQR